MPLYDKASLLWILCCACCDDCWPKGRCRICPTAGWRIGAEQHSTRAAFCNCLSNRETHRGPNGKVHCAALLSCSPHSLMKRKQAKVSELYSQMHSSTHSFIHSLETVPSSFLHRFSCTAKHDNQDQSTIQQSCAGHPFLAQLSFKQNEQQSLAGHTCECSTS